MKNKYKFLITFFCLLCISLFNFNIVHAADSMTFDDSFYIDGALDKIDDDFGDVISTANNVALVIIDNKTSTSTGYYTSCTLVVGSSPLSFSTSFNSPNYVITMNTSGTCSSYSKSYYTSLTNSAWSAWTTSPTAKNSWLFGNGGTAGTLNNTANGDYRVYNIKGSVTFNGSSASTGSNPSITDDDILNYNWSGDGLKIYNLKKDMNVSGYVEDTIKYFDIECYGKFTYKGSNTFFTSFAYKKMQTSIQLASCMSFGSETRSAGQGLGIKSFEWISNKDQLNTGDEVRFRIVYQAPLISKGTYSIKVGTTINNGVSDSYISDEVSGVKFLNSNWVYNEPLDTSGETGNVGDSPGNSTWEQSNSTNPNTSGQSAIDILGDVGKSVINFFKTIVSVMSEVGNIAPQIATLYSAMFSFLPSPIPQLVTTSLVLIIFIAVLKFLRG